MEECPFIYAQLSSDAVLRYVTLRYDLPSLVNCVFYVRGLHDNYLVEDIDKKFILRIYRNNWRTEEEIGFELGVLNFLGSKTALVAFPLHTKSGELSFFIDSPEGKRSAALFHYADGHAPGNEISIEQSNLLGNAVAKIHRLTDAFEPQHNRPILEIPYLLDESLIAIEPFVSAENLKYLKTLGHKLHRAIPVIAKDQGKYGICIGDVNPTNFHVNAQKQLTIFDFDQCGNGYRAFEIGKFISSIHTLKGKKEIVNAFMVGYQQVRQLSEEEILAIPFFEMLAVIWVMAINVNNVDLIGLKWLEKPFWDRKLSTLKELESAASV